MNLEAFDVIKFLNKNLIIHFVWYLEKEKRYHIENLFIDKVWNKEYFLWKNHEENVHQKLVPDSFLILISNSKQLLHAKNF